MTCDRNINIHVIKNSSQEEHVSFSLFYNENHHKQHSPSADDYVLMIKSNQAKYLLV